MRNNQGIAIAFFALIIAIAIGFGALVIDLAQAYSLQTRIKNAIDIASLAGISQLINQTNITASKNTALQYLNTNLSMTISNFDPITLNDNNLLIQCGIYNSSNMTFTLDETSAQINSLRISYKYNSMSYLAYFFMINNIPITESSTSAKQVAGNMAPGGGFPLAIQSTVLAQGRTNNNMIDLSQTGTTNSFFTAFDGANANTSDIKQIINYFTDPTSGIKPPSLTVGQDFQINNGSLSTIYMTLQGSNFIGKTFVSPIVTLTGGFSNMVTVEGFIGWTINNIYKSGNEYHIAGTIIPSYIDNNWSGLTLSAGPVPDIAPEDQSLLATSYGLVQ